MKKLLTGICALAIMGGVWAQAPSLAGDWLVRAGGVEVAIAPEPLVKVQGERMDALPAKPKDGWRAGGWMRGRRLKALVAYECSVAGALAAGSVVVRNAAGDVMAPGRDYELEATWGAVARLEGGCIGPADAVFVDYAYRPQRLDRLVRTASGATALRKGAAKASNPVLPALEPGDVPLATVWVDGRTEALSPRNFYPVLEQAFPETPVAGTSAAERLLPKTYGKLVRGEPVRVLAWGDSVTNGGYLPEEDRWQGQFIRRLRARFPKSAVTLVSNGWGGRSSASFLSEKDAPPGHRYNYVETVLGANADLVVMEFVNDSWLSDYGRMSAQYDRILSDLRGRGAELCVLTPHYVRADWMGLADPTATTDDPRPYVKNLRRWCAERGVAIADASLRWGRLARQGLPYQTLLVNEINHPNALGMSFFADALMALFRDGAETAPVEK